MYHETHHRMPKQTQTHDQLTAAKILALVHAQLPAWVAACDAEDTDAIALHESEFGSSTSELLLFACAIKFAAKKGKNVYVTSHRVVGSRRETGVVGRVIAVYREKVPAHPGAARTRQAASRN
jgi:hypothetical protein